MKLIDMESKHNHITEELSDKQLLSLYFNPKLNLEVKQSVTDEIAKRGLTLDKFDDMKNKFELDPISVFSPLMTWQKILIVLFPISPYLLFWDIYGGNVKKVQGHLKYSIFGFVLWSAILLGYLIFISNK